MTKIYQAKYLSDNADEPDEYKVEMVTTEDCPECDTPMRELMSKREVEIDATGALIYIIRIIECPQCLYQVQVGF